MHAPRLSLTMDVPERYEQLIAFLDSKLPQPVDRQTAANGALSSSAASRPRSSSR